MKKPNLPWYARCVICGKPVKTGEKYEFSVQKDEKIAFFHTECYEKIKKKG